LTDPSLPKWCKFSLKNNKERYLSYKKYPESVRKYIYTTNVVENINSRIEKNKCKEPLPLVKSALYELKQMFVKKFYGQTQFS